MRQVFPFLLFALSLVFGACGERVPAARVAAESGILVMNNGGEPSAIDPQFAQPGVIENRIMLALFEGLVRYDPQTLAPVPAIAQKWEVSDDGCRYRFYLRGNAKFSDGKTITADDFIFSFRRILSPALASPTATMFFAPVKNARAFAVGEISDFSQVGFKVIDEHCLEVTLEKPCPYFLSLVCHSSWSVVPAHVILKFGAIDERQTQWTRVGNFVGSGPYTLKDWRVAYRIETCRNDFYWDKASFPLEGIRFDAIEDQFAEERAFRDGQYHITNTVPPASIAAMRAAGTPSLRLDDYLSTAFIRINTQKTPLNDARVRLALSLALDRQDLAEKVMRAGEKPAKRLVPPGAYDPYSHENADLLAPSANVARARQVLAEAGYPDGKGFPTISYLYNTSDGAQFFAQALQEQWRKNLGIRVVLQQQEYKVYRVSMAQGDYELARSSWSGDYLDPTTFLDLFGSRSHMNWTGWNNDAYDRLLDEASRERVPARRMKLLSEAEKILLEEMPVIPTVYNKNKFLIRPEVRGWFENLLDIHPYCGVSFQK
ncbi:MAG: peptide ABC transporter substrate-binding protein [Opitutales bacterium]|nr:peptide ABC transporter substrate-binding protein [Opitutales bacterium]